MPVLVKKTRESLASSQAGDKKQSKIRKQENLCILEANYPEP